MSNVVGERYEISIDTAVREQLGIKPGDRAVERVEGGRLVVESVPKSPRESLLGIFRDPSTPPITGWQAVTEAGWDMRVAEIMEVLDEGSRRHREDPR